MKELLVRNERPVHEIKMVSRWQRKDRLESSVSCVSGRLVLRSLPPLRLLSTSATHLTRLGKAMRQFELWLSSTYLEASGLSEDVYSVDGSKGSLLGL